MHIQSTTLLDLPLEIIYLITEFMTLPEINQLGSACKILFENCFIGVVAEDQKEVVTGKSHADILYLSSQVKP